MERMVMSMAPRCPHRSATPREAASKPDAEPDRLPRHADATRAAIYVERAVARLPLRLGPISDSRPHACTSCSMDTTASATKHVC